MSFRAECAGAITAVLIVASAVAAASIANTNNGITGLTGSLLPYLGLVVLLSGALLGALGAPLRGRIGQGLAALCGLYLLIVTQSLRGVPIANDAPSFQLQSVNMLATNTGNGAAIARQISGSGSDVTFVMEDQPIQPYLSQLAGSYPYQLECAKPPGRCDSGLLSRFPLENTAVKSPGPLSRNRILTAVVSVSGIRVTVVGAHLTKPYFDDHGYEELLWLTRHLDGITGPLVVVGDFNQASWSPMLSRFLNRNRLHASAIEPATWPADLGFLGIPIDHVFTRDGAWVAAVDALPDSLGSNHRGLVATIRLSPATTSPEN